MLKIRENLLLLEDFIKKIKPSSILDLGCKEKYLEKVFSFKRYVGIDICNSADIKLNLNNITKLPFKNNSFEVIVASQILEHLFYPLKLIKEIKRISKGYIIIGLPNEYTYDNRIKFLFGEPIEFDNGYQEFGHHYIFDIDSIDQFIKQSFKEYIIIKKKYLFASTGGRLLPKYIRNYLARVYPKLFAKEVYYLLKKK